MAINDNIIHRAILESVNAFLLAETQNNAQSDPYAAQPYNGGRVERRLTKNQGDSVSKQLYPLYQELTALVGNITGRDLFESIILEDKFGKPGAKRQHKAKLTPQKAAKAAQIIKQRQKQARNPQQAQELANALGTIQKIASKHNSDSEDSAVDTNDKMRDNPSIEENPYVEPYNGPTSFPYATQSTPAEEMPQYDGATPDDGTAPDDGATPDDGQQTTSASTNTSTSSTTQAQQQAQGQQTQQQTQGQQQAQQTQGQRAQRVNGQNNQFAVGGGDAERAFYASRDALSSLPRLIKSYIDANSTLNTNKKVNEAGQFSFFGPGHIGLDDLNAKGLWDKNMLLGKDIVDALHGNSEKNWGKMEALKAIMRAIRKFRNNFMLLLQSMRTASMGRNLRTTIQQFVDNITTSNLDEVLQKIENVINKALHVKAQPQQSQPQQAQQGQQQTQQQQGQQQAQQQTQQGQQQQSQQQAQQPQGPQIDPQVRKDAIEGLCNLGYTKRETTQIVDYILQQNPTLKTPEVVTQALRIYQQRK